MMNVATRTPVCFFFFNLRSKKKHHHGPVVLWTPTPSLGTERAGHRYVDDRVCPIRTAFPGRSLIDTVMCKTS